MKHNKAVSDCNEKLGKLGLYSFQHRFVNKVSNFTHNLTNEKDSPELLRNIVLNRARATFEFFLTRFLNHFSFINFSLDLSNIM